MLLHCVLDVLNGGRRGWNQSLTSSHLIRWSYPLLIVQLGYNLMYSSNVSITQLDLLIMYPSYTLLVSLATLCQDNHTSHLRLMSGAEERRMIDSSPFNYLTIHHLTLFVYPLSSIQHSIIESHCTSQYYTVVSLLFSLLLWFANRSQHINLHYVQFDTVISEYKIKNCYK